MSSIKQFVRREIIAREREFIATVKSERKLLRFDDPVTGGVFWVVDIDIGSNRIIKNVPVKAGGSGSIFYAQNNQTVKVRRTALGRFYVIGPGDLAIGSRVTTTYSLDDGSETASATTTFTRVFFPYESYMGTQAVKGNPNITFSSSGDTITRDAGDFRVTTGDGFAVGDVVRIGSQSALNEQGSVTILSVTEFVLGVDVTLFDEGPIASVTILVEGSSLYNTGGDTNDFYPYSRIEDQDGNAA